jgi:hypothetical protein
MRGKNAENRRDVLPTVESIVGLVACASADGFSFCQQYMGSDDMGSVYSGATSRERKKAKAGSREESLPVVMSTAQG